MIKHKQYIVDIQPPDPCRMAHWLERLHDAYGGAFTLTDIGYSRMGRGIPAIQMGRTDSSVLYCGGVHGREWITTLLLLRFAEEVLDACTRCRRLCGMDVGSVLSGRGLVIVPALNPDGIDISINGIGEAAAALLPPELYERCRSGDDSRRWKANAAGVDINRNFNAAWDEMRTIALHDGIRGPALGGWTGEYPESEPETQAIVKLCEERRFHHALAFHAQGEEIYWNYRAFTPPKAHLMAKLLAFSSGYVLREPAQSASSAGFKDWFMQTYHAPAFTIEVGCGECPLPLDGFPFLYNRLREMMVLGAAM